MRRIVAVLLWIIVLLGLVYYLILHAENMESLIRFSAADIIILVGLFILTQFSNSTKLLLIVRKAEIKMGVLEAFHITNINTMVNYLPLKAGAVALAVYFKKKHSLSYMNFTKLLLANQIVQVLAVTSLAALFVVLHYLITGIFFGKLFYIFCILFLGILCGLFLVKALVKNNLFSQPVWEKAKEAVNGLGIVLNDKVLMRNLLWLNLLTVLTMGARLAIAFKILSFKAPLILPFIAGQVKIIAVLLSVTPSGLGIAELAAGGVSEVMNSGVNIGIYAASVDRVLSVLFLIIMSGISFVYIYRHKKA